MKQLPILRVLAVVIFLLLFAISLLSGGWYRSGWCSRRPIMIDNSNSGNILWDFQVGIQIPYYAFMQENFDDIRFTTDDGVTEIPYWIEEYTAAGEATVWVRVPHISAYSTEKIYLYYHNQSAESASNGKAVFEYFDNFNDQDISDWTVICGDWTAQNKYLEQMLTANHRKILSPYSFDSPPAGIVVEAKMNYMSTYYAAGNCIFFSDNWGGGSGYRFGYHGLNGDGTAIDKIYQWLDSDPTIYTGNYGYTWLKGRVTYDGNGHYTFLLKAPGGVSVFLQADDTEYAAPFVLGNYCGSHTGIDNFRVRKYSKIEPGYDIYGEQKIRKKKIQESEIEAYVVDPGFQSQKRILLLLPRDAIVSAHMYDCLGRKVASICKKRYFTKGEHLISLDSYLAPRSSGSYFIWMMVDEEGGATKVIKEKLQYMQ